MNARATLRTRKSAGRMAAPARPRAFKAQSLVEMALFLPILLALVGIVVEGGLALNAWLRVTTAARDATRFTVDAGRPADTATLVLNKLANMDNGSNLNIYIISVKTNSAGNISTWSVNHVYGSASGGPRVQRASIQQLIRSQDARDPNASRDLPFQIVEVDYDYRPVALGAVLGVTRIPMTSYALIQQYMTGSLMETVACVEGAPIALQAAN